MKKLRLNRGLFILLLAAVAPSPYAGSVPPTLPEVIQVGIARNPDLPLAEAVRGQGQAARTQASELFAEDPAFLLRHETDAANDDLGYRQWESGLAMPLWLPGQRARRFKVADTTEREADALQRLHAWQVAGDLRELLWSIRIAQAGVVLARHTLQSARDLELNVTKRVQAGDLARTDLILAQKETLAREIELEAAISAHEMKLMHYGHLTGLSLVPMDLQEEAAVGTEVPDNHPALRAVRETLARARADRDQVRGERRANPVLAVGGKTERPESAKGYDAALFFELNLPLGTKGQAVVRNAAAQRSYTEAMILFTRTQLELKHDLHAAIAERDLAVRSLQLADHQNALAAESLRLMQRAFELGETDLFTLLQARTQALAAERDFNRRRLEQGHSVARLNQALGVIPE